jgi:hypothetical protein
MAHSQIAKKTKQSEEYGEYEKLTFFPSIL